MFITLSCTSDAPIDGAWNLSIELQEKTLPVLITLKRGESKNTLTGTLANGGETLELEGVIDSKGLFEVHIAAHYAKLKGKYSSNSLKGNWIRTNKENFAVPFSGASTSDESLFASYEGESTPLNISGKWKLDLGEGKVGLGNFTQEGSRIQGSILTNTGDYRFLDGHISQNKLSLYGFDGVFSFIFEGVLSKDQFVANMHSGVNSLSKVTGVRDENFELSDPLKLTKKVGDKAVSLKVKTIDGDSIDLDAGAYKGRVKIIQVFGSWCPNCHDESNFFAKWRLENIDKLDDVKFIALSFERSGSREQALRDLKRVRTKLKMDYDVVLSDFDNTVKVTDVLPLDKTVAFPTTLFLNRSNQIKKIHTGFSGQATGEYFKAFEKEFNSTVDDLLI